MALRISAGEKTLPPGDLTLQAEITWIVQGTPEELDAVQATLPARVCRRLTNSVLTLWFGNAVGRYQAGPLGTLEVVSGKWGESDYDRLLERITEEAEALPFAAGEAGSQPFERAVLSQDEVLYHAFAYLRHILSPNASTELALRPALEGILRTPHRRLRRTGKVVPLHAARRVESRILEEVVSGRWPMVQAGRNAGPLAACLGGRLPISLEESVTTDTIDTPENRFVKAFLAACSLVIERMRFRVGKKSAAFRERILTECTRLERVLRPVQQHSMWRSVGSMSHFPAASTVLQRQRSYRTVFVHDSRLRLGSRLPLDVEQAEALLEVKDIALLYELWSCFALIQAVSANSGPPASVTRMRADALEVQVPWEYRARWSDGTEVLYNPRFSRNRIGERRSFSVPLRPDLALRVPAGRLGSGLHLLDAKFKVDWLAGLAVDEDNETLHIEERAGTFKRADLYKMHTYRDAIPHARSAWVLYPGTVARFYPVVGAPVERLEALETVDGVGGVPLGTDGPGEHLVALVAGLLVPQQSSCSVSGY